MKPSTAALLAGLAGVAELTLKVKSDELTPRQQKALAGGEACLWLCAYSNKLDDDEVQTLAKAGLIFGAVLAGER